MVAIPNPERERDNPPRNPEPGPTMLIAYMEALTHLIAVVGACRATDKSNAYIICERLQDSLNEINMNMGSCSWDDLRTMAQRSLETLLEELKQ